LRKGCRGYVALAVVREEAESVYERYLERLSQALDLRYGNSVYLLRGLPRALPGPRPRPRLADGDAPLEYILLEPGRQLIGRDQLAVRPAVELSVRGRTRRAAPGL
jgi:hypothetical protein